MPKIIRLSLERAGGDLQVVIDEPYVPVYTSEGSNDLADGTDLPIVRFVNNSGRDLEVVFRSLDESPFMDDDYTARANRPRTPQWIRWVPRRTFAYTVRGVAEQRPGPETEILPADGDIDVLAEPPVGQGETKKTTKKTTREKQILIDVVPVAGNKDVYEIVVGPTPRTVTSKTDPAKGKKLDKITFKNESRFKLDVRFLSDRTSPFTKRKYVAKKGETKKPQWKNEVKLDRYAYVVEDGEPSPDLVEIRPADGDIDVIAEPMPPMGAKGKRKRK